MRPKITLIFLIFLVLGASSLGSTIRVAVKRGQEKIDPDSLPLACITIGTAEKALPLDVMVLENIATHKEYKAILSKTFNSSHPDLLTAVSRENRSLSMAILHLPVGRYQIKSLEFVGPSSWSGISSFTFDLTQGRYFAFTVQPNCANYIGSLMISANWNYIRMPHVNTFTGGSAETNFGCQMTIEQTAERDMKWASDMDPGMRLLRSVSSPLEQKEP